MSKSVLDLSKEFVGRRALVTGGSRGIGAAIAQRFLDGGASVVVTARSPNEETPTAATFIKGDVRTNEGAKAIVGEALRVLGGLDILVNNAGAARVHLPGAEAISDEEWVDSVNVNFLSAVRVTAAALPALRKSKDAAIINVSSGGASPLPSPLLHYGSAKAALNAYTKGLAQELAPSGIRVNIVTPGPVVTPGGDEIRKVLRGRDEGSARSDAGAGAAAQVRRAARGSRDGRPARLGPRTLDDQRQLLRGRGPRGSLGAGARRPGRRFARLILY